MKQHKSGLGSYGRKQKRMYLILITVLIVLISAIVSQNNSRLPEDAGIDKGYDNAVVISKIDRLLEAGR